MSFASSDDNYSTSSGDLSDSFFKSSGSSSSLSSDDMATMMGTMSSDDDGRKRNRQQNGIAMLGNIAIVTKAQGMHLMMNPNAPLPAPLDRFVEEWTTAGPVLDTLSHQFLHAVPMVDQQNGNIVYRLMSTGWVGPKYEISGMPILPPIAEQRPFKVSAPAQKMLPTMTPVQQKQAAMLQNLNSDLYLTPYPQNGPLHDHWLTSRFSIPDDTGSGVSVAPRRWDFVHISRVRSGIYAPMGVVLEGRRTPKYLYDSTLAYNPPTDTVAVRYPPPEQWLQKRRARVLGQVTPVDQLPPAAYSPVPMTSFNAVVQSQGAPLSFHLASTSSSSSSSHYRPFSSPWSRLCGFKVRNFFGLPG